MTSQSGDTNLTETTDNTLTIPTLASGSYTSPSDFPANHWGYKKDSGSYIPFATNTTILESDTYANDDTTTLSFATKIDYLQASGTYKTTLVFTTTANPLVDYIQDFTAAMCQEKASSADYAVVDKRDGNEYTVRYINGDCWMTQNLRYQGDIVGSTSTTSTWYLKSATSNVSTDITMPMTDLTSNSPVAYDTNDYAKYHNSGNATTGVWYNYAAVSAMTITGSSNTNPQIYDICPKGWRLPTGGSNSEQSAITSYASAYSPIGTGHYSGGTLHWGESGYWWSSTSSAAAARYAMVYYTGSHGWNTNSSNARIYGETVRCIRSS